MIDINNLEKMCKERPDDFEFKKTGILKLIDGIRTLEIENKRLKNEIDQPFYSLTDADIMMALNEVGIANGDVVLAHWDDHDECLKPADETREFLREIEKILNARRG